MITMVDSLIDITIAFSGNVTVTNTPRIQLETGTTDRYANYLSGSGNDTLTFRYTVVSGDSAADLGYVANNSLDLNTTGTITDGAGNNAVLTLPEPGATGSLSSNKKIVIDTDIPTIDSVYYTNTDGYFIVPNVARFVPKRQQIRHPAIQVGSKICRDRGIAIKSSRQEKLRLAAKLERFPIQAGRKLRLHDQIAG